MQHWVYESICLLDKQIICQGYLVLICFNSIDEGYLTSRPLSSQVVLFDVITLRVNF